MKRTPPRHGKLREARDRQRFRKHLGNALDRLNAATLAAGYQIIRQEESMHHIVLELHSGV